MISEKNHFYNQIYDYIDPINLLPKFRYIPSKKTTKEPLSFKKIITNAVVIQAINIAYSMDVMPF